MATDSGNLLLNLLTVWKFAVMYSNIAQGEAKIFDEAIRVSLANRHLWWRVSHGPRPT